jgi:hypothetical protein
VSGTLATRRLGVPAVLLVALAAAGVTVAAQVTPERLLRAAQEPRTG